MNVCLITVDCLRNDFLQEDYADTPFIDRFIDDSLYFSDMHSTATTTTPSVASYFTGRYSENNGINTHSNVDLRDDINTIGELFQNAGYNTYAMVTGPLVEETGLNRGFDPWWYRERNKNLTNEWKQEALEKRDSIEEPFFLYVHLWELHGPIHVPAEFDSPEYGDFNSPRLQDYTRILSALDRELKHFINGLPDNTITALHGDHGEHLTGVGRWHHNQLIRLRDLFRYNLQIDIRPIERLVNRFAERITRTAIQDHYVEESHGHTVYEAATNVPFVVNSRNIKTGSISEQCRQIDIYPTLLDAAKIDHSSDIDGESLITGDISSRKAYIRACGPPHVLGKSIMKAIRMNGYKYIEFPNRDWGPELYELSGKYGELRPISDPEVEQKMRQELPSMDLLESDNIDIDELLEDLGYI